MESGHLYWKAGSLRSCVPFALAVNGLKSVSVVPGRKAKLSMLGLMTDSESFKVTDC